MRQKKNAYLNFLFAMDQSLVSAVNGVVQIHEAGQVTVLNSFLMLMRKFKVKCQKNNPQIIKLAYELNQ